MPALFWVLTSSLGWIAADAFRKRVAAPVGTAPLGVILSLGSLAAFLPWWLSTGGGPGPGYLLPALVSLAANIGATLLMLMALERGDLSVVIPLLSITPVLSALGEWATGGAVLLPRQWVGVVLVVVGALALQLRGRRFEMSTAAWMILGVAVLFSVTAVSDAIAVQHTPSGFHAVVQASGMVLGIGIVVVARGELARLVPPAGHRLATLGAVAGFGVGYGAQLVAFESVPASLHETVKRAVGMTGALVLGRLLFGEAIGLARVLAVVAMAVGVGLVLL